MVRIPRPEPQLTTEIAHQPQAVGSGWGAPGRALQQLGSSISSLAGAFDALGAEQQKQQTFQDQLALVNWSNQVDANEIQTRNAYNGDGTDYTTGRQSYFDDSAGQVLSNISPAYQNKAQLYVAGKRGSFTNSALIFEGQQREGALVSSIEDSISTSYAGAAAAPQDQFEAKLLEAQQGVDLMINSAPVPETRKEALRSKAAQIQESIINEAAALEPDGSLKLLPRVEQLIDALEPEQPIRLKEISPQGIPEGGGRGAPGLPGPQGSQSGPAALPPPGKQSTLKDIKPETLADAKPAQIAFADPPLKRTVGRPRGNAAIKGIVFHQTWGSDTMAGNGSWSNKTGTGAHYYVAKDGTVYQWAPDDVRMGHAGKGRGGKKDIRPDLTNANTIGIEIMTRPNERPNEIQIATAKSLGQQLMTKYDLKPTDVVGHGEIAPGHRMATEAIEVVRAIRGAPGVTDKAITGKGIKPMLTAYSPQRPGSPRIKKEGGYSAKWKGPDGEAMVRTLEDVRNGRSKYITIAGDDTQRGKEYVIPEITYRAKDGTTHTLKNVKAVVHDRGDAFKGKGSTAIDIPVDRDMTGVELKRQPFSKQRLALLTPEEAAAEADGGGAGAPRSVAQRGITQYAGMSKLGGPTPGMIEPGNINLDNRQTVKNADGSTSTERSFSVNIDGKEVLLPLVIGGKVVSEQQAIAHFKKTRQHLGVFKDPQSANAYAQSLHQRQGQRYASQDGPRKPNTIPAEPGSQQEVQVADASGTFVPQSAAPRDIPLSSVGAHLRERLLLKLPAYRRQYEGAVVKALGDLEEAAGKGYALPPEQMAVINEAVNYTGNPDLRIRYDKALAGLEATQELRRMLPDQVEGIATKMRASLVKQGIPTATPDQLGRVEGVETLAKTMRKELDENPIGWGINVGLIPEIAPITPQTLTADVLVQRAIAGRAVADYYGQSPKFFLPEEREVLKGTLSQGGKPMLAMLNGMYEAFGDDMPHAMREISKDVPEAATLGWLISAGGSSQAVLDAADAVAFRNTDEGKKAFKTLMPSSGTSRETAVSLTGNAFSALPGAEQRAIDLANVLYVMRAQSKGLSGKPDSFDSDLWEQGFNEVLGQTTDPRTGNKYGGLAEQGGFITSWTGGPGNHGVKVVLPTNVRTDALPEIMEAVRITDLVEGKPPEAGKTGPVQGGEAPIDVMGRPLSIGTLRRATLVTIGDGRYWMALGDPTGDDPQWVGSKTAPDGRFVLDLKKLEPVLRERVPSAYKGR